MKRTATSQAEGIHDKKSKTTPPLSAPALMLENIIDVSSLNHNCGLFALTLGVRRALASNPNLHTKIPIDFLRTITDQDLREVTMKTRETGVRLRMALHDALFDNVVFKTNRYHTFVGAANSLLAANSLPPDMEALITPNQNFLDSLKTNWKPLHTTLFKINKQSFSPSFNVVVHENVVRDWVQTIKVILRDNRQEDLQQAASDIVNILIQQGYSIIAVKKIYQLAWNEIQINDAPAAHREIFHSHIEYLLNEHIRTLLLQQEPHPKLYTDKLFMFGLLKGLSFKSPRVLNRSDFPSLSVILENARTLYVECEVYKEWQTLYQNYLNFIKSSTVFLSSEELSCLADSWGVELRIAPYQSRSQNPEKLQVSICNPLGAHWQLYCEQIHPRAADEDVKVKLEPLSIDSDVAWDFAPAGSSDPKPSTVLEKTRNTKEWLMKNFRLSEINQHNGINNCGWVSLRVDEYLSNWVSDNQFPVEQEKRVPRSKAKDLCTYPQYEGNYGTSRITQNRIDMKKLIMRCLPFSDEEAFMIDLTNGSKKYEYQVQNKKTGEIYKTLALKKVKLDDPNSDFVKELQSLPRNSETGTAHGFVVTQRIENNEGHILNFFVDHTSHVVLIDAQERNEEHIVLSQLNLNQWIPDVFYIQSYSRPGLRASIKMEDDFAEDQDIEDGRNVAADPRLADADNANTNIKRVKSEVQQVPAIAQNFYADVKEQNEQQALAFPTLNTVHPGHTFAFQDLLHPHSPQFPLDHKPKLHTKPAQTIEELQRLQAIVNEWLNLLKLRPDPQGPGKMEIMAKQDELSSEIASFDRLAKIAASHGDAVTMLACLTHPKNTKPQFASVALRALENGHDDLLLLIWENQFASQWCVNANIGSVFRQFLDSAICRGNMTLASRLLFRKQTNTARSVFSTLVQQANLRHDPTLALLFCLYPNLNLPLPLRKAELQLAIDFLEEPERHGTSSTLIRDAEQTVNALIGLEQQLQQVLCHAANGPAPLVFLYGSPQQQDASAVQNQARTFSPPAALF